MAVIPYKEATPIVHDSCFIAPDAWAIGDIILESKVSMFFGAVARGDIEPIRVGEGSNLQEHALLHTSIGGPPCIVGKRVTVGHRAILHGCTVEDDCIIGMGATVLDGAVIGRNSILGAQSLVVKGTHIPEGSLALGIPAKVVRKLSALEIEEIAASATRYIALGSAYRAYFNASRQ